MDSRHSFLTRLLSTGALALGLFVPFACGGKVVFVAQGQGGSSSASGGGMGGTGGVIPMSTNDTTSEVAVGTTSGGGFSTGDVSPCTNCAAALMIGNLNLACPGQAQAAAQALIACACATGCPASCGDNLCAMTPPTAICQMCLQSTCAATDMGCQAN